MSVKAELFSPDAAPQPADPKLAAAIIGFVLPFVFDLGQIESQYHQGGLPLARRWHDPGCRRSPVLPPRNPSAACPRTHDDAHRIAVAAAFVDKLAGRRTVCEFAPTPVPRELIEHCLHAASRANQQPCILSLSRMRRPNVVLASPTQSGHQRLEDQGGVYGRRVSMP